MSKQKKKKSKLAASRSKKEMPIAQQRPEPELSWDDARTLFLKLEKEGELEKAAVLCSKVLQQNPDDVQFLFYLSNVLLKMSDYQRASAIISKAIDLKPDFAEGYCTLGNIFFKVDNFNEACKAYQKATDLKDGYIDAWFNMGNALKKSHNMPSAIEAYEQVLKINPNHIFSMFEVAPMYFSQGDMEKAKHCYETIYKLNGDPAAAISSAMLMPLALPDTWDGIHKVREEYEAALDKFLTQEGIAIEQPHKEIKRTSFRLAYHGLNDKDLMVKLAHLYEKVSPHLLFEAPHCKNIRKKEAGEKIRVGIVSKYFFAHSVSRSFNEIMEGLINDDKLDVHLISTEQVSYLDEDYIKDKQYIRIPLEINEAQRNVADLELDVILYAEIGMDPITYCLAYARLAPIQAILPGHPVTSGIKNMDYYFSSTLLEIGKEAQDHYSEELVLFDNIPSTNAPLEKPDKISSKAELGLPEDKNIYLCPMKLQKLHPEFDDAIKDILIKDENGVVVIFEDIGTLPDLVMKRLKGKMDADVFARVLMLPWASKPELYAHIYHSDVTLDPYYFGGGTTGYMILDIGSPIVSWPCEFLRGRTAISTYTRMGIQTDLIVDSKDKYADMAIKCATDKEFQQNIKEQIAANRHKIFDNSKIIPELVTFFEEKCKDRGIF